MGNWAGSYGWHETHTAHNLRAFGPGVVVSASHFHGGLAKAVPGAGAPAQPLAHPHTAAHGLPQAPPQDFSGGQAHATNDQAAVAGSSKAYGRFAAPYGTVDPSSPSVLKFYPLEGKRQAADALLAHHGYMPYYAGGKHGRPDLASRNYNTKHLMIYDPEEGSGGDFGSAEYTDAWRKTHELAHALTYPALNAKYGEGRRIGALGKQRTPREAKRAIEWEWLAAHKQRQLAADLGVHISDDDFHRELNTVMHDAVHRAVTGKFTEPSQEGFQPHAHKVPLETALGMVDEASRSMGLHGDHDLLRKNLNLSGTRSPAHIMADEVVTRNDIRTELVKNLKGVVVRLQEKEAAGKAKLAKAEQKPEGKRTCPACGAKVGIDKDGHTKPHAGCKGSSKSGEMAKDDFGGESMAMGEKPAGMVKAEMCKSCGYEHAPGEHMDADGDHDGDEKPMKKDEDVAHEPQAPVCKTPGCGRHGEKVGLMGETHHYLCPGCGETWSVSASSGPDVEHGGDDPITKKAELPEVKSAAEKPAKGAVLPDGPGKAIEAEGSGSDPKKGKLAKADAEHGEHAYVRSSEDSKDGSYAATNCKICGNGYTASAHFKNGKGAAIKKGDTWNPATGAAEEAHVRGSVIAAKTPAAAPKKSAKDVRGVPAEQTRNPLAKAALPGGATPPPIPAVAAKPAGKTVMSKFRLGAGGTPAGAKPPLPGMTAALPKGVPAGAHPDVAASLGELQKLKPQAPAAKPPGQTVMGKLGAGGGKLGAAPTSAAKANHEIGGFKSIAGAATHLAPMGKGELEKGWRAGGPRPKSGSLAAEPSESEVAEKAQAEIAMTKEMRARGRDPHGPSKLGKAAMPGTGAPAAPKAPSMAAPAPAAKNPMATAKPAAAGKPQKL